MEVAAWQRSEKSRRPPPRIAILHIPHSARYLPADERQAIQLDHDSLSTELLRITDAHTDELFPVTPAEAGRVVFPLSRLVCDVERFSSDEDEPMAARGMGVIYTRTSVGETLRAQPNETARQTLLEQWYWPHHTALEGLVNDVAARSDVCLIVDCHSFPSVALPYELDQNSDRADICIGTDPFHTPLHIRNAIAEAARHQGYSAAVDAPFAGALVPLAFYRKDRRIKSVMIEVNRRLYMDENTGGRNQDFGKVSAALGRLIETAAEAANAQQ